MRSARASRAGEPAFAALHPAVAAAVLLSAIVLGVLARRPSFIVASAALAAATYLALRGRAGVRGAVAMLPVVAVVAFANPLFATMGDTVLFSYAGGRPYTLEALAFGACAGATLAATLLWFGCWNAVMTTDRLSYLLGRAAPSLAVVVTLALRFVPGYERALARFSAARACVGQAATGASGRARRAALLLSQLTTWAFEGSVTTASSLRARGFGLGRRTSFVPFRFTVRDGAVLAAAACCCAIAAVGVAAGSAGASFYPTIAVAPATPIVIAGFVAFVALLAIPLLVTVREALSWRISLSRI